MVRCRSRFALLCLAGAVGSAGMPLAGFVRSMFDMNGADAEEYEENLWVQTEADQVGERSIAQRDFVLNDEQYAVFNRLGQKQFQILQQQGRDSACWRHAATSIDADCAAMSHARKQRLAVQLSNCHLQDSGRKGTRCSPKDSDERCVKAMQHNDLAFESYTTFFHHVNAICYHLSHTVWQEQTEGLVRGLTASSLATFDRAEKSLMKQELVLEGQERASIQTQVLADGLTETSAKLAGLSDSLSQELVSAMREIEKQESLLASLMATQAVAAAQASSFSGELGSAKSELASYMQAIEEDRRVAKDQNLDLMKTIGFIHDCLDNASSAWARFQAFTYLILAVNLCWVLTTAPPLRPARTALFALVAFGIMLEKSLCGDGGSEGPVAVDWLVAGLRMSPETFTVATWAKIFNQEKIRWLTFQAGAAILSHALVSYYLPCLEIGRLAASLRGKCGFANSETDNNHAVGRQTVRLLSGSGGSRGGAGGNGGTAARRAGRYPGTRVPPSPAINHVGEASGDDGYNGDESEHDIAGGSGDSHALGVEEGEQGQPYGASAGGSGSGGGRAWVRGDSRADGLDELTRKELQSLAKETHGVVRANAPTIEIVKGLRDLGITANAPE